MTVSNLDMYFSENLPIKSYSSEMLFTTIKCIFSSSQPIPFFFKLLPRIYRGDSGLLLSGARIPIFSVVEKEKRESKMASFAN